MDLLWAGAMVGLAVGIIVGAIPVYAEWKRESRQDDAKYKALLQLAARTELNNIDLRAKLETATPLGLTPVYDGIVIDLFRREIDQLNETHETFGGAS